MPLRSLAIVLILTSAQLAFGQRVQLQSFSGPGGAPVRTQLAESLCRTSECVPPAKSGGTKIDWDKARKEQVQAFVTGAIVKKGKKITVELALHTESASPAAKKVFTLDKKKALSGAELKAAVDFLSQAISQHAPAPQPTPAPAPEPAPAPAKDPEPAKPAPAPVAQPAPAAKPKGTKPPALNVDVGADVGIRNLAYTDVVYGNARKYDLPVTGSPAINVQFFPLALARTDALARIGLEGGFSYASWIVSRIGANGPTFPSQMMRVEGGLRFDIVPSESFPIAISPFVGIRMQNFTVSALKDGTRLDGVPNISYFSLRAGLGLEVPIVKDRFGVFGRFAVLPTFSNGEITSANFFTAGSTFGIEAGGGISVGIVSFLQVRASFEYTRYALTFKSKDTDPFQAKGASDTYLGGNASLRFSF